MRLQKPSHVNRLVRKLNKKVICSEILTRTHKLSPTPKKKKKGKPMFQVGNASGKEQVLGWAGRGEGVCFSLMNGMMGG